MGCDQHRYTDQVSEAHKHLLSYSDLSRRIRAHALCMTHKANASHIGSCLSIADILAVLYGGVLQVDPARPGWPDRDRFILSKGHGAAAIYAVLAERGFFPKEWLDTYCQNGSKLAGHITYGVPGVDVSTGSLGHGLPIGCGMALAAKRGGRPYRIFVLLSDGECDEGSTWEAVLFSSHHLLDNLIAIVDYNKLQAFGAVGEVMNLEPLEDKWRAFGWSVRQINGHHYEQISDSLTSVPFEPGKPSCIIAHTVKGKGVSFMENQFHWHYKSPNSDQLAQALEELGIDR
ncbi:MAG: transketolase [Deltaproteobacteria bacterium]|nr:MAG: transketolase [Deltaproteobacteria bacterium]